MKELDLHGYYHHEVIGLVENFVLMNHDEIPLRIITGKSESMRNFVIEVLNQHDYDYHIPPHNFGEIVIVGEKIEL
jgi:DNA-nicking Smr family endonuclease